MSSRELHLALALEVSELRLGSHPGGIVEGDWVHPGDRDRTTPFLQEVADVGGQDQARVAAGPPTKQLVQPALGVDDAPEIAQDARGLVSPFLAEELGGDLDPPW